MASPPSNAQDIRQRFVEEGFEIVEQPGSIAVKKYNCIQYLKQNADGSWVPSGAPRFIIRGTEYELEDRGYQKFWYANGKRVPIRVVDLKTLHRFDEEVRAILGLNSLYHESLGTVNARTVYDRLEGRPEK
jgi:hypothetical protein